MASVKLHKEKETLSSLIPQFSLCYSKRKRKKYIICCVKNFIDEIGKGLQIYW
jgi:hypothetical protein